MERPGFSLANDEVHECHAGVPFVLVEVVDFDAASVGEGGFVGEEVVEQVGVMGAVGWLALVGGGETSAYNIVILVGGGLDSSIVDC